MSKRCNAGAGDVCVSEGCGLAWLTLSGRAPHMTAGSSTGSSSLIGINGELLSSISSDLVLSKASSDSSVSNEDCSQDESFS